MLWLTPFAVGGVDKQKEALPMARRQLKTDDEAGFLMAVYDDVRETEMLFRVKVKFEVKLTSKRGQLRIYASAWKGVGTPDERGVAAFECEYPTASAARLHAALYRAAIGIGAACSRAGLPYQQSDGQISTDGDGQG